MDAMRADMGGAATVCASIVTAASLKLPVNIIGEQLDTEYPPTTGERGVVIIYVSLSTSLPWFIQVWHPCVRTCPAERLLNQGML